MLARHKYVFRYRQGGKFYPLLWMGNPIRPYVGTSGYDTYCDAREDCRDVDVQPLAMHGEELFQMEDGAFRLMRPRWPYK